MYLHQQKLFRTITATEILIGACKVPTNLAALQLFKYYNCTDVRLPFHMILFNLQKHSSCWFRCCMPQCRYIGSIKARKWVSYIMTSHLILFADYNQGGACSIGQNLFIKYNWPSMVTVTLTSAWSKRQDFFLIPCLHILWRMRLLCLFFLCKMSLLIANGSTGTVNEVCLFKCCSGFMMLVLVDGV